MHDFSVFRTVSGPYDVQLLTHISAGYRASNAGYVAHGVRRLNKMVPLARGSPLHEGLSRLLPHAIDLLERNEGVPLAPRARFAALDGLRHRPGGEELGRRHRQKRRARGALWRRQFELA